MYGALELSGYGIAIDDMSDLYLQLEIAQKLRDYGIL